MSNIQNPRVMVYVDGYNLYYGLRQMRRTHGKCFYWLDLRKLAQSLMLPKEILVGVKYFTSLISEPPDSVSRQAQYIKALETLPEVEITHGNFLY